MPPSSSDRNLAAYSHSAAHRFILLDDHRSLSSLLSSLPKLSPPSLVQTPSDAALQLRISDQISAVLDRRDVPGRDTPLHLAVRLSSYPLASALLLAGADPSLQNASGWTPLQESLSLRRPRPLSLLLLRHHRLSAYSKFRRRLPSLLAALSAVPDFYLELAFRFDCSLLPFLSRAAPSDVYRVWKRGAHLRADTTLAGFDGLKVRRADQSFIFNADSKALLVLNRGKREVRDAFEGLDCNVYPTNNLGNNTNKEEREEEEEQMKMMMMMDERELVEDASAYRPGLDITKAELVKVMNWRRKERVEMVGEWKSKVYEMNNVVFSFKTMKPAEIEEEHEDHEEDGVVELELDEEAEEGYIVAEMPMRSLPGRHSCSERGRDKLVGVDHQNGGRRSLDLAALRGRGNNVAEVNRRALMGVKRKEKETVKNLRPMVWLTEDFPLKTEELLPIFDILANKVKAVRRLRELLTTKFPPGTFPVKVKEYMIELHKLTVSCFHFGVKLLGGKKLQVGLKIFGKTNLFCR